MVKVQIFCRLMYKHGASFTQATLCDALPAREWPPTARQLLQGMVNLLTALLHTATEGPCAQRLLSLLFEVC